MSAVKVSPTCAVPLMVGAPVAGLFGRASTVSVAALVSVSSLPASSVKVTRTLMILPRSVAWSVWVEPVAPSISVSLLDSHW